MPWINKIKQSKQGKPHHCGVPGVSWRTKNVVRGSTWECNKCGRIWYLVLVEYLTTGGVSKMTWNTGYKREGNYQKIVRLSPVLTDI
jgi:hypothetical protein